VRGLLLWAVLFGAYAATLGVDAVGSSDYGGDEPRHLLTAESLVSDGDLDLTDEYAERAYARFGVGELAPRGRLTLGRRHEPHGLGFPLLIAPAYAVGGAEGVELFLAAMAALAFALAAALARRVVPEPWASGGVLGVALSAPALACGATVSPELCAGALLVGAALMALRVRETSRLGHALAGAAMLAFLPWLGTQYLVPAAPIAVLLVRWTARRGRRLAAIAAAEVIVASVVTYVTINERLYGGPTPGAAGADGTDPAFPLGYLERAPRLVGLWIDRDHGLLRWAPVLALAGFAAWLLWRSRRGHVARIAPERGDAEAAAALALAICAGHVLVAALWVATMRGPWFPGLHLAAALPAAAALTGWGLRHAPRTGAVLAGLTAIASVWLLAELASGGADGWIRPDTSAPLGPAVDVLPVYDGSSAWPDVLAAGLGLLLAAVVAREWWAWRSERPGVDRRAAAGTG
jgi:hypothetical protein